MSCAAVTAAAIVGVVLNWKIPSKLFQYIIDMLLFGMFYRQTGSVSRVNLSRVRLGKFVITQIVWLCELILSQVFLLSVSPPKIDFEKKIFKNKPKII